MIQKQIQAEQPAIRSFKRIAGCWFKELIKPAVFQWNGLLIKTVPENIIRHFMFQTVKYIRN